MDERTCVECERRWTPDIRAKTRRWCYDCLPPHGTPGYLKIYKRLMRAERCRRDGRRVCEDCSSEFVQVTQGPLRRWCYDCVPRRPATVGPERNRVDRIRWMRANPAVMNTCEACGVTFDAENKIYRRWCLECLPSSRSVTRTEYLRRLYELDPDVYQQDLAKARAFANLRRARKLGARCDDDITLEALLQRDGNRCHICRRSVSAKRKHPHPLSPTIDHIIPISVGGTHTWENVAVAHFRCNCSKGNRAANDQLRLIG